VTPRRFAARPVSAFGVEQIAGHATKMYGIAAAADRPRAELVDAARTCAASTLLRPTSSEEPAFVIAHDAVPACFVLVCWWANGCDLRLRCFHAPLDRPAALEQLATPTLACVWELAVIAYERDAWVKHVLGNEAGPDLQAYLRDQMRGTTERPVAAGQR
jgi:hypothetical protein